MTSKITKGTVKFSEKIGLDILESLDGFLIDSISIHNQDDDGDVWSSMEDFRHDLPNADKFAICFTYGNGIFSANIAAGKFDKILIDLDEPEFHNPDTEADDRHKETNVLRKELELAVAKLKDIKEVLTHTDEPPIEVDLF